LESKVSFSQCLTYHRDVSVALQPPASSVPVLANGFATRGWKAACPPTSFGGSGSPDVDSLVGA